MRLAASCSGHRPPQLVRLGTHLDGFETHMDVNAHVIRVETGLEGVGAETPPKLVVSEGGSPELPGLGSEIFGQCGWVSHLLVGSP